MQPIELLENAIERAEEIQNPPITLTATLAEVYRIARRGFTDSEATYWSTRIIELIDNCPEL